MAIFKTKVTKAAISPQEQPSISAAAGGTYYQGNGSGEQSIGEYYSYIQGDLRNRAMRVPTINRARDLIASVIGNTPMKMYRKRWDEVEGEMTETEFRDLRQLVSTWEDGGRDLFRRLKLGWFSHS